MEKIERYSSIQELYENEKIPLGMLTGTTDPVIIEILGYCGFDFVVIDNEHGGIESDLASHLFRAADASGLLPLVRVVSNDPILISKMLDAGARGIVVPHIETREEAQNALNAIRFPPEGPRGWCPSARIGKYSLGYWKKYSEIVNKTISIIPIIESARGVENIDEIVAVPEIEVVNFGPGDLSHELGVAGQGFESIEVQQAMNKVLSACKKANKKVMGFPFPKMTVEGAQYCLDKGFNGIIFGMDLLLFTELCSDIARSLNHRPRW